MPYDERTRAAEILLIEDNGGDVRLMNEALREVSAPHHLHVAETGAGALEFLRREEGAAPRADLILLDLQLPDMHGLELLAEIKSDAALRRIPTVVFSSSQNRAEVSRAYDLNANSYIAKPVELADFIRVVQGIEEFWLRVVKLPKE
jgi:chemotaxis family two-component system response regulator Rcp1